MADIALTALIESHFAGVTIPANGQVTSRAYTYDIFVPERLWLLRAALGSALVPLASDAITVRVNLATATRSGNQGFQYIFNASNGPDPFTFLLNPQGPSKVGELTVQIVILNNTNSPITLGDDAGVFFAFNVLPDASTEPEYVV